MLKNSVVTTFSAVLLMSLMCSISLQQSHADMAIAESADLVSPLKTGEPAPSFFVRAADGSEFYFDPDALARPAVIITFRGGWCPFCNMHLSELRTVVPEIAAMDVDVLFLSGDRPEMLYASLAADTQEDIADLDYKIYSDADAQAAIALGIAFKASDRTINRRLEKGQDIADSSMIAHGALPVPAVYAIDTKGMIRFDFVEANYKVRLPSDELLAVAKELAETAQ
ncbi:MAG: peroxiredoxin-like family protein [Woeseiaceae bacterium]